jgi:putative Ca2+/H+ antiporter (TMEM165/GDT1 family)
MTETLSVDYIVAGDKPFESFLRSFFVIIVSEIGDKTFFIAAILAMKNPRMIIFLGASLSLIIMTILSALLGNAIGNLISRNATQLLGSFLFLIFSIKMFNDAREMSDTEGSKEMEEVEEELYRRKDNKLEGLEAQKKESESFGSQLRSCCNLFFTPIFVQTFVMTFLAEWGDRSQITTIALSATDEVWWVTTGACLAHSFCTGLAVLGGKLLATRISVRTVTYVGSVSFLIFGVVGIYYSVLVNN